MDRNYMVVESGRERVEKIHRQSESAWTLVYLCRQAWRMSRETVQIA